MKRLIACVSVMACSLGQAQAAGDWLVSGFGTVGAVRPSDSQVSLLRNGINTPGRDGIDFGADSVLGIQAGRNVAPGIDVTAQVIVREDQTGHVEPRVAWAFLCFNPLASMEIRLGRLRVPFFMYSESLWINYANPWVRPPTEVYGLNPFSDLDGADLTWRSQLGQYDLELRPFIGRSSLERQFKRARLKRVLGLNATVFRDDFSVHVGHAESPLSLPWSDPLFLAVDGALRQSGQGAVADQLSGDSGYARFDSVGLQWDDSRYLLSVEYARRAANRYIPSAHGWEVTLGTRLGQFTLYSVLARQSQDAPVSSAQLPVAQLQAGLDLFNASRNTAQRSVSLGVRMDVHRNAALKIEFTQAKVADASMGSFFPVEDSGIVLLSGRRINMISTSLDFTF
ncbi:MAG: hypothetical protein KDG55_15690 [Rhodocyclaceae bacterium]|nr:hypothetical protein [Rhodocyclaceae bacterium]